jgi:hypothetical protein
MSKIEDGGPAFPVETYGNGRGKQTSPDAGWETGLSIRDWFAGQALGGLAANPTLDRQKWHDYARGSYAMADAMLAERNKEKTGDAGPPTS